MSLLAYGQFKDILTPENWKKMESGLSNPDTYTQLIDKSTFYVCTENEKIVGIAYLMPSGNPTPIFEKEWSYIRLVAVNPEYVGKGIAQQLTQRCVDFAKQSGEKIIALHTSEFMDAARHIYEKVGFKKIKEFQHFDKRYWLYKLEI